MYVNYGEVEWFTKPLTHSPYTRITDTCEIKIARAEVTQSNPGIVVSLLLNKLTLWSSKESVTSLMAVLFREWVFPNKGLLVLQTILFLAAISKATYWSVYASSTCFAPEAAWSKSARSVFCYNTLRVLCIVHGSVSSLRFSFQLPNAVAPVQLRMIER